MGISDLIIAPVYITLFTILALFIRPYLTNKKTKKYFLPALWARFVGAIVLGMIYQFYYDKGDTFNYFHQAQVINDAFLQDPLVALKLIFNSDARSSDLHHYVSRIPWFRSTPEFAMIRIIGFLSLFTFNAYLGIAMCFAFFSFLGAWLMFSVFQRRYDSATRYLKYSILFMPSCIVWGSGILKDTLTLGALGILVWFLDKVISQRQLNVIYFLMIFVAAYLIFVLKIYILLCFIPSIFLWWYLENVNAIRNKILRVVMVPIMLLVLVPITFLFLDSIAGTSEKYSLENVAERAYITAYDIRYFSGKKAGSGYDIGEQDGTLQGLVKLAPAAVNVSLFRPYIWEVRNPLMVFSAIESLILFLLTIKVVLGLRKWRLRKRIKNPLVFTSFVFAISFAFAVGVSTYNFGSLSRYKIPLLPFYASAAVIALSSRPNLKYG